MICCKQILIFILLITLLIFPRKTIFAEDLNLKVSKEIYTEFLSPYCPGRALIDCPSQKATVLKEKIFQEVKSGKSKNQVLDDLLKEYGNEYSSKPKLSGFASLAWIVPIAFPILIASFFLFWILKNKKRK